MTKKLVAVFLAAIMIFSSFTTFAIQLESAETAEDVTAEKGILQSTIFNQNYICEPPFTTDNSKTEQVKKMTDVKNFYKEINNLKQRCKELSQENLFLKSEIADMRISLILLGGK